MTDGYDPRWHAARAQELLRTLSAEWDAHPERYRKAAVRSANRRLARALADGEPGDCDRSLADRPAEADESEDTGGGAI